MSNGLSDRDRERLEQEQAESEGKSGKENKRLGRITVNGPDGRPVILWVAPSGMAAPGSSLLSGDTDGCLIVLPILLLMGLFAWLNHVVMHGKGYTLHVKAQGRRKVKLRERCEEAAAQRLRSLAAAIERDGIAALDAAPDAAPNQV